MLQMALPDIAQPPWGQRGKKIESMIRKALYEHKMLANVSTLALALSGGKDSLTLLFMLKAILGKGFPLPQLVAIHVGGAFSCGPSIQDSYLSLLCERLEIPYLSRKSTQTLQDLECYSCSRERRRLIFEAAKSVGADTVAFGHHRDDHTQTLLMNLLHKGEFAGNLPRITMENYGVTIIRPLIYVSEKEIRHFAKEHAFIRTTCQCIVGEQSMRKKVERLLQDIETLFPNARSNLAQAGFLYGSDKASKKHDPE